MDFQNRPGAKTGGGGAATQGMADRWGFLYSGSVQFFSSSETVFCQGEKGEVGGFSCRDHRSGQGNAMKTA